MIQLRTLTLLLTLGLLSACGMLHSVAQSGQLLAPESFGLTPIARHLYVEAGADEATKGRLRADMDAAETAIRQAYGSVSARPTVHACVTENAMPPSAGEVPWPGSLANASCSRRVA